jgi:hypothetical protein
MLKQHLALFLVVSTTTTCCFGGILSYDTLVSTKDGNVVSLYTPQIDPNSGEVVANVAVRESGDTRAAIAKWDAQRNMTLIAYETSDYRLGVNPAINGDVVYDRFTTNGVQELVVQQGWRPQVYADTRGNITGYYNRYSYGGDALFANATFTDGSERNLKITAPGEFNTLASTGDSSTNDLGPVYASSNGNFHINREKTGSNERVVYLGGSGGTVEIAGPRHGMITADAGGVNSYGVAQVFGLDQNRNYITASASEDHFHQFNVPGLQFVHKMAVNDAGVVSGVLRVDGKDGLYVGDWNGSLQKLVEVGQQLPGGTATITEIQHAGPGGIAADGTIPFLVGTDDGHESIILAKPGESVSVDPLPSMSSSIVFREMKAIYKDGTWSDDGLPQHYRFGAPIPGIDHCGINLDDVIFEAQVGYRAGNYWNPDTASFEYVQNVNGVQAQQSRGVFRHNSQVKSAISPTVAEFREVEIPHDLASRMVDVISPLVNNSPYPSSSNFGRALLDPELHKGAEGSWTCVGLVEWAAEEVGHNGGEGFIPDEFETLTLGSRVDVFGREFDFTKTVSALSPALLYHMLAHPDDDLSGWRDHVRVLIDPADWLVTDPEGRRVGFTAEEGFVNEFDDADIALYAVGTNLDEVVIFNPIEGEYQFEITGIGTDDNVMAVVSQGQNGLLFDDMLAQGESVNFSLNVSPVPEPNGIWMALFGLGYGIVIRRRMWF